MTVDLPKFEDHFKQLKFNLWLMGIPYGDFKIYLRYFAMYISLCIMILEEGAYLFTSVDFLEITILTACWCIGFLSLLKITTLTFKRRKFYQLTENMKRLYEVIENDPRKREIVRPQATSLSSFLKFYFAVNGVLILVYNFTTLVVVLINFVFYNDLEFMLPYAVLLPFEVDSWLIWGAVYTFSVICGIVCVLYFTTCDILYCVLTSHICANFAVISEKLENLEVGDVNGLKQALKDHQNVLQLSQDLEDIFTASNLLNVLIGSIEICLSGFNLMMGELSSIPGSVILLLSVILQMLLMSVFGENLITESSRIGQAAYNCKWYEMDNNSKKTILILMSRCHRPQTLTAYKFSVISYGSFSKIISTSWSYFTILRTVYTPPESLQKK